MVKAKVLVSLASLVLSLGQNVIVKGIVLLVGELGRAGVNPHNLLLVKRTILAMGDSSFQCILTIWFGPTMSFSGGR